MADEPWTIIVDGNGGVSERKLGGANPGSHVAGTGRVPSVKVTSSSVNAAGTRTVVMARALKVPGAGGGYYTFNVTAGADPRIPFICAVGNGPKLGYHKDKSPSTISLLPLSSAAGACVCPAAPKPFGSASLCQNARHQFQSHHLPAGFEIADSCTIVRYTMHCV